METKYPEIDALNEIYIKYKFEIKVNRNRLLGGNMDYPSATFTLSGKSFDIYLDDELEDLKFNYPLLNLCLVLRELEGYEDAEDYLIWCQDRYFKPENEEIRAYHMSLGETYREVEKIIGKVDSMISDWDFEMGSGASWVLRKKDPS